MQSLKITVGFESPVGSELQSDTIFGQFAWELRYIFGEDKLKEVLEDFETSPFVVFSDGFPEGSIAVPFVKPQKYDKIKKRFGDEYYIRMKNIKKARYVRLDDNWLHEKVDLFSLEKFIVEKSAFKNSVGMKNSVNRISNTTDAGLYTTQEKFFMVNVDIYAKYDDKKIKRKDIEQIFESIGKFGFGKDKSVGKGRFRVVKYEDSPKILEKNGKTAFVSLSSGIPCTDCEILFGKTFTKFGKHGGDLIFGNPFKNPAVLFKSGSIFKIDKTKDVYGSALRVSNYDGHYQNSYMIPVFIDVEE